MKEFLLIFRNEADKLTAPPDMAPEAMQDRMQKWMDWLGGIAAQNKLVSKGNRLFTAGNTVKPGNIITDGPYTEIKEVVGGYSIIHAATLAEATEMAKGCPVLMMGGSVEVREINLM